MSENKNDELDQYGAGPFEQQQFGTAGVEGVKEHFSCSAPQIHATYRTSYLTGTEQQ